MPYTRVFQFRCCDATRNEIVIAPMMAKRETIDLVGGQLIKHSAQDVETHLVDALGFYPADILRKPLPRCPRELMAGLGLHETGQCPTSQGEGQAIDGT